MKPNDAASCHECGARLGPGAEACDLCGLPVEGLPFPEETEDAAEQPVLLSPSPSAARPVAEAGVFCNECGWKNPEGARFCSQCGSRLQELAGDRARRVAALPPRPDRAGTGAVAGVYTGEEDGDVAAASGASVGQRVAILIAAGTLLVVALFLVTVFSRNLSTPEEPAANSGAATVVEQPAVPLAPELAERVASIQAEIDQATGEAKLAKQRELVGLYLSSNRIDLASQEQERIAQATDAPEDWTNAGNYLYGWMEAAQGDVRMEAGRRAIAAYERVLAMQPENLSVRTDMATVLLGTNRPMEGVAQVKQVLEADPNHMQANFNYGVMLSMIGRRDQAIEQFEKVKTLVGPETEEYRTAEEAIRRIKEAAPAGQSQPNTPGRS